MKIRATQAIMECLLEQFLSSRGSCVLICKVHPDVGTND